MSDETTPTEVMANAAMLGGCQECGLPPGWLVVDPADPDVIDRVACVLAGVDESIWALWDEGYRDEWRSEARDVLAALSAEAQPTLAGHHLAPSLSVQRRLDVMRGDQR